MLTTMLCMGVTAQAATVTVNDPTDGSVSSACTLRDAVAAVNTATAVNSCAAGDGNNDTITFDAAVFSAATTIMVSPQIVISKELTINGALDGSGDPLITLDGNSANTIFYAYSGTPLTVSGLIFRNGGNATSIGGAIISNSILGVSNSAFINCQSSAYGGAIYARVTANISNSVFDGNHTNTFGTNGGAIYASTANISDSEFINNWSVNSGGAISASNADISNSVFIDNEARGSIVGGAAVHVSYTVNISDSTFIRNKVPEGNSGTGGAISGITANVSNSAFDSNRATSGGAIHASTANVSNSTFTDNQASSAGYGGAIYGGTANVSNSAFAGNRAGYYGGAIYVNVASIGNSTFIGNQAISGGGGAIGFGVTLEASHLTLLDNNAAGAATYGAAIFAVGDGSIHNSLILSSVDSVNAATLCATYGAGSLGGSYNIEWVDSVDTTTCGGVNNVSGGSGTIGAIVATALADNGGPTPTLALPAGSPAIGAADSSGATSQMLDIDFAPTPVTATWIDATLDQRGVARAVTSAERSIGAFEKAPSPPPPVNAAPIPVLPAPLALLLALGVAGIGFRKLKVAKR
ncbi:MAG: hypothetical protein LBS40_07695 [Burkholderiales bacterium]|jgi:predicted outer membrane repeat protein|nr:hypothetical protein [Burkholderiales bacterium]